jgi:hypothetical protein
MANFMNPEYIMDCILTDLIKDFENTYGTPLEIKKESFDIKILEKSIKTLDNYETWTNATDEEKKEIEESIRTATGLQFKTMQRVWDVRAPNVPFLLRCSGDRYRDGVTRINVFTFLDNGQAALIKFEHKTHGDGDIFRTFIFDNDAVQKSIAIEVSKETKAMYPSRPMYPSTAAEHAACAEYDAVAENKSAAKRAVANKRAADAEFADAKEAMMLAEEKYNVAKAATVLASANAKDAEIADNPDALLCGLTAQLAEDASMAESEAEKMYNVAKAAVDAVVFPEEGENPYRECICGTDNECVKNGDCSACLGDDGYCDGGCGETHCYISSRCYNWNIYIER